MDAHWRGAVVDDQFQQLSEAVPKLTVVAARLDEGSNGSLVHVAASAAAGFGAAGLSPNQLPGIRPARCSWPCAAASSRDGMFWSLRSCRTASQLLRACLKLTFRDSARRFLVFSSNLALKV